MSIDARNKYFTITRRNVSSNQNFCEGSVTIFICAKIKISLLNPPNIMLLTANVIVLVFA